MGLPEVADFARNFAVMVRVQGPDPKGLKMRNHAFHHYISGKTTLSASGTLLPGFNLDASTGSGNTMQVLTVASVIEPFLSQQYRQNISTDKPQLVPGARIDILLEGKKVVEGDKVANEEAWLPAELIKMVNIPESSSAVQSLIEASSGSMEHGWEVGWSLASHNRSPQHIMDTIQSQVEQSSFQSHRHMLGAELSNPNLMGQSTTRIALLTVPSKLFENFPKLNTSVPKRGDLLLAMGSPFGTLSPVHFFNNLSVGSICNSYPPSSSRRSLLMVDIRCLPGMEGSPVFGECAQLIGLLTRPLRQKNSGTEIQLVIPWDAIASACSDWLHEEPHVKWKGNHCNDENLKTSTKGQLDGSSSYAKEHLHSGPLLPNPIDKAMPSICLVTIDDGSWASGVLLNKQGLILTNAHLLEPWRFGKAAANGEINVIKSEVATFPTNESTPNRRQNLLPTKLRPSDISLTGEQGLSRRGLANISHRSICVRLDFMDPWTWSNASIVYVSRGPLDIALLKLETAPDQLCPIVMDFTSPSPGSKAYVIGHGLFGPRCNFLPSACLGVISKVIEAKRPLLHQSNQPSREELFPAMFETTAAVHPGSSGGAVVNSDGHMIGLVTSNARHGGGTVIPHLNFSIPCAALEPIFKFSKDMQDYSLLEDLDKPNEHLSSVWALMPPLSPRPGPFLPNLPQFPVKDNKETKGSRFSKFIAETNEFLKNTAELGMDKNFSNKLIPSKL
ncbi:Glyoxysomal proCES [Forsythia ovata]|uniref:Glyoxysomal proCES n=1 Tax=Forsythia ovata TaxID=205694 RepID=A0ABD1R772_9LAMI